MPDGVVPPVTLVGEMTVSVPSAATENAVTLFELELTAYNSVPPLASAMPNGAPAAPFWAVAKGEPGSGEGMPPDATGAEFCAVTRFAVSPVLT